MAGGGVVEAEVEGVGAGGEVGEGEGDGVLDEFADGPVYGGVAPVAGGTVVLGEDLAVWVGDVEEDAVGVGHFLEAAPVEGEVEGVGLLV